MWQELVEDLLLAHFEERVIHGAIVAQVDQVSPAILGGWTEIGVLEEAGERVTWIADVDPIAVCELAVKGKDKALRPVGLPPIVFRAVVGGKGRDQARGQARRQGGDHTINGPGALAGSHLPAFVLCLLNLLDACAK